MAGDRDSLGDKYLFLSNETPPMLYWVAPIWTDTQSSTVVGAVLMGEALPEIVQTIPGTSSDVVAFFDPHGKVLAGSLTGVPSLSTDVRNAVTQTTPVRIVTQWQSHSYRLLVKDWTMRGNDLGYVGVAVIADDLSGSLNAIRLVLVALFGAIALGTILIGLALADRITRPIDRLVASMARVSAGDYSRRVEVESADEIGYLAQSFNAMTAALEAQIRAREEAYFRNLEALARVIDARDPYTFEHSARVEAVSQELAEGMGLPTSDLVVLRRAGLLHDIGKIGVADAILGKKGPLNDEEWAAMRPHESPPSPHAVGRGRDGGAAALLGRGQPGRLVAGSSPSDDERAWTPGRGLPRGEPATARAAIAGHHGGRIARPGQCADFSP